MLMRVIRKCKSFSFNRFGVTLRSTHQSSLWLNQAGLAWLVATVRQHAVRTQTTPLLALSLLLISGCAAAELELPRGIETYPDGRKPVEDLFHAYTGLLELGWQLDIVIQSQPAGTAKPLPIIALRSPQAGAAVWVFSGVHGEEPAGPQAIAASIDDIAKLGARRAVVLLPLCNPQGYARNWRYLNTPVYSDAVDGQSVGDSSHVLADAEKPEQARAVLASSPEANALAAYVLATMATYPPTWSIDLHEDNLINAGYVYSQGVLGDHDPLAETAVRILEDHNIPIKTSGTTRFNEAIVNGIIGPVTDSSIDELMSAAEVVVQGKTTTGPAAHTVLVFETPASDTDLEKRIAAHTALLHELTHKLGEN